MECKSGPCGKGRFHPRPAEPIKKECEQKRQHQFLKILDDEKFKGEIKISCFNCRAIKSYVQTAGAYKFLSQHRYCSSTQISFQVAR